ncbi:MAG TPA: type 4a pilus biogenesis protein PilO [Candidatus Paceibacterota bacterium]
MKDIPRILIVLVVLDMLGLGVLWFGYSTMGTKKEEGIKLRQELADEKQKAVQFVTLGKVLKQIEKESGVLEKYLYSPGEESQINFVSKIEALGAPTGILLGTKSLDLVPGTEPNFHGEFTLKGRWEEIYHFLRLVEEFPARIVVKHFSISAQGQKNVMTVTWNGTMSIDLTSVRNTP